MDKKRSKRQKAIIKRRIFVGCCLAVLAVAVSVIVFLVNVVLNAVKTDESSGVSSVVSQVEEDTAPKVVSSATVVNTGDILVHSTVLDGAKKSDGSYDFSDFFKNVDKYFKGADLAVANLEVTLGGSEAGAYSGYPAFNTPDSIVDTIKNSGISMLLTANNHCYDTGVSGLKRTVERLKTENLLVLGTRQSESESKYLVKSVNGIKIGMVCYTYENQSSSPDRKSINGNLVASEANSLINSFSYDKIDSFYSEAQSVIESMKKDGADAIVFYMHWGQEYQLTENTWQRTIAQKLCNFGVDVLVGGHPHVVQPMSLLHSEDSQNTTVCIYSLGNAISNQRQEIMNPECVTGHTEDGMLFSYTFDKYSDGTTVLSAVDIVPTWVDKYKGANGYLYTMYPLENAGDGTDVFALSGSAAEKSKKSYERTREIVSAGLTECQTALGCDIRFKD